jgi:hypothetical protein
MFAPLPMPAGAERSALTNGDGALPRFTDRALSDWFTQEVIHLVQP